MMDWSVTVGTLGVIAAVVFAVLWLITEVQLANARAEAADAWELVQLSNDIAAWEDEVNAMQVQGPFGL